jgi:hypothetical protein
MAYHIEPLDFKNKAKTNFDETCKAIYKFINQGKVKRFKIGKSEKPKNRYVNEHSKKYDDCFVVKKLSRPEYIDLLEIELISAFIHTAKCDNEQIGGGRRMADVKSDWFYVYLVVNYK